MRVGEMEGRKLECGDCEPNARTLALEKIITTPGTKAHRKVLKDAAIELHRVVATCDAPITNEPFNYRECRKPLCGAHATNEPQEGHHRCRAHAL